VGSEYGAVVVEFEEIPGGGVALSVRGEACVFRGGLGFPQGFLDGFCGEVVVILWWECGFWMVGFLS
jgi:hypothetical protein